MPSRNLHQQSCLWCSCCRGFWRAWYISPSGLFGALGELGHNTLQCPCQLCTPFYYYQLMSCTISMPQQGHLKLQKIKIGWQMCRYHTVCRHSSSNVQAAAWFASEPCICIDMQQKFIFSIWGSTASTANPIAMSSELCFTMFWLASVEMPSAAYTSDVYHCILQTLFFAGLSACDVV